MKIESTIESRGYGRNKSSVILNLEISHYFFGLSYDEAQHFINIKNSDFIYSDFPSVSSIKIGEEECAKVLKFKKLKRTLYNNEPFSCKAKINYVCYINLPKFKKSEILFEIDDSIDIFKDPNFFKNFKHNCIPELDLTNFNDNYYEFTSKEFLKKCVEEQPKINYFEYEDDEDYYFENDDN